MKTIPTLGMVRHLSPTTRRRRKRDPAEQPHVCVREGNRAVPVRKIYRNGDDDVA